MCFFRVSTYLLPFVCISKMKDTSKIWNSRSNMADMQRQKWGKTIAFFNYSYKFVLDMLLLGILLYFNLYMTREKLKMVDPIQWPRFAKINILDNQFPIPIFFFVLISILFIFYCSLDMNLKMIDQIWKRLQQIRFISRKFSIWILHLHFSHFLLIFFI